MLKKIYARLQPFKFRLTLFFLLCGASLISIALLRIRSILSGTGDYTFLLWNLFLAWIPLALAYAASTFAGKRRFLFVLVIPAALL